MFLLILYLSVALFISFLCSILESVLLSTPITYLRVRSQNGDKSATEFIKLKNNIDKPISAILSLNTIAHTVGAAGVGAQATIVFGEAYFGVVSAILTILILVLTEIIPKTLGTSYNTKLIGISVKLIKIMIIITYPIIFVSGYLTKLFSKKEEGNTTSREEISTLANIGMQEGVFKEKENQVIQNLITLYDMEVSEIMTPRTVLMSANEEMILSEFVKNNDFEHHSRIPIYHKNADYITGYVLRSTILEKLVEDTNNSHLQLKSIKRDIESIHSTATVFHAWEKLLENKEHIVIIIDEFGGVDGIVTLEDILETLIGQEIVDERDKVVDMQQHALDKWHLKQNKNNI